MHVGFRWAISLLLSSNCLFCCSQMLCFQGGLNVAVLYVYVWSNLKDRSVCLNLALQSAATQFPASFGFARRVSLSWSSSLQCESSSLTSLKGRGGPCDAHSTLTSRATALSFTLALWSRSRTCFSPGISRGMEAVASKSLFAASEIPVSQLC